MKTITPEPGRGGGRYARRRRVRELLDLGGCCSCCGETYFEFLQVDHIFGWQGTPISGERILCANCHMALTRYGACPHRALNERTLTEDDAAKKYIGPVA